MQPQVGEDDTPIRALPDESARDGPPVMTGPECAMQDDQAPVGSACIGCHDGVTEDWDHRLCHIVGQVAVCESTGGER